MSHFSRSYNPSSDFRNTLPLGIIEVVEQTEQGLGVILLLRLVIGVYMPAYFIHSFMRSWWMLYLLQINEFTTIFNQINVECINFKADTKYKSNLSCTTHLHCFVLHKSIFTPREPQEHVLHRHKICLSMTSINTL